MKGYIYINPNAPAEVKDLVAEHFSDVPERSPSSRARVPAAKSTPAERWHAPLTPLRP